MTNAEYRKAVQSINLISIQGEAAQIAHFLQTDVHYDQSHKKELQLARAALLHISRARIALAKLSDRFID